jgi:AcrR family transcriptional regulator
MPEMLRRPPGRPRLAEQRIPTEDVLLQSAARLFLDRGYEPVTMDDVAQAAGVTKATVYYHYTSKAELFTSSVVALLGQVERRTREILDEVDLPLAERLRRVAAYHLGAPEARIGFEAVLREARGCLSPHQLDAVGEAEDRIVAAVAESFQDAVRQRELRPLDPLLAAQAFMALVSSGQNARWLRAAALDVETHAARILDLLWHGLAMPIGVLPEPPRR